MSLSEEDRQELNAGRERVRGLMLDYQWHSAETIRRVAGLNGIPASEGLRRLRELRKDGLDYEKRRIAGSRLFEYRLVDQDDGREQQEQLFDG